MTGHNRISLRMMLTLALGASLCLASASSAGAAFVAMGEPTVICGVEYQQHLPSVGGTTVVWQDERYGSDDIRARDLRSGVERTICSVTGVQGRPRTDGSWVVWEDGRSGVTTNVFAANLATGKEEPIALSGVYDCWSPDVDAGHVVWSDTRNGNFDIYAYDLATKLERPVCTDAETQLDPAVSGDTVVWQDMRTSAGAWGDIYAFDLTTGLESAVCTDTAIQQAPAISGTWVVWQDYRNDNYDIYAYNLASGEETAVCTAAGDQTYPRISGSTIVWEDRRGADADVYAYDLASATESAVCTATGDQVLPDVSGWQITWQEESSNGSRIVGAGPRPAYDAFAAPRALYGSKGVFSGVSSWAATRELGEPKHAGATGASSLWFTWTAPDSGTVTIDLAGSTFDTLLGVYSGSVPASLTAVASNDDVSGSTRSRVTFTAAKGRVYRIAVDGKGGAFGTVRVAWALRAKVGTPSTPSRVSRATRFTAKGTLKPKHAGHPPVTLVFQRYERGAWRTKVRVKASTRAISGANAYSASVRLTTKGSWRVYATHVDRGHTTSQSGYRRFTVR